MKVDEAGAKILSILFCLVFVVVVCYCFVLFFFVFFGGVFSGWGLGVLEGGGGGGIVENKSWKVKQI